MNATRTAEPTTAWSRRDPADDVRELISAAGPLTIRDIAGGLDAPIRRVAGYVEFLLSKGCLRPDEFQRYRLSEGCAAA